MTNMYGLPVEAIIAIDQEGHTQLLGYSIIPKGENSFANCFKDYLYGKPFRIIIIERLESKYRSLKEIFPSTFIAFCFVHIRNDLYVHFDSDDEIIKRFYNMRNKSFLIKSFNRVQTTDMLFHYLLTNRKIFEIFDFKIRKILFNLYTITTIQ